MNRIALHLALALVFCTVMIPVAFAADLQTAKVYRDYPGYITPPTCENPQLSGDSSTAGTTLTKNWNRPYAWTLTPMIGYHVFDGGLDLDNHVSVGLSLGYNLTNRWTMEADLRYTPTQTDFSGGHNEDVNLWAFSGGVLYHFMPEQRFNPYLEVGLGGLVYDFDHTSDDDEDPMGYWGGGIKYAINSTVAVRVDLRHMLDYRSDGDFESHGGSDWRHHLSSMMGLTYQFGR